MRTGHESRASQVTIPDVLSIPFQVQKSCAGIRGRTRKRSEEACDILSTCAVLDSAKRPRSD